MLIKNAFYEEKIHHKTRWLGKVRLFAVCIYTILIILASSIFKIETDYLMISGVIVFLFFNAFSGAYSFKFFSNEKYNLKSFFLGQSLLLDIILVSLILFFTGGYTNPFSTMLLLYVFLTSIALDERWTWFSFLTASVCYISLFYFYRPIELFDSHHGHHGHHSNFNVHLYGMLISFVLLGGLFSWFFSTFHKERMKIEEELLKLKTRDLDDQKLIALTNFCAGAAHELGTPLASCKLIVEDLARKLSGNIGLVEDVKDLDNELQRIIKIVQKIRSGAEIQGDIPKVYKVRDLLNFLIDKLEDQKVLNFNYEVQSNNILEEKIFTFKDALISSIVVLIQNAKASYINKHNKNIVKLFISSDENNTIWKIEDNGAGMEQSTLDRLGEPFFTTKDPGEGMGLGIYLVKSFCRIVHGDISFKSTPNIGTTVELIIPKNSS